MKALYVDWHLPRKVRGFDSPVKKPWEIAMIVRTTHYSRKHNNFSPVLYCDPETYDYYKKIDLLHCFDEIRPVLPTKTTFNPSIFWAAGKFYAIKDCREPFLMVDLDAEIRFKLSFEDYDVYCAHPEGISKRDLSFYPDPAYLDPKNFFGKKLNIKWSDKAYNTCLLYFKDPLVSEEYSTVALEYMSTLETINPAFEGVAYILLAEQRFLYEYCRAKNFNVGTLIKGKYVPTNYDLGLEPFEESDFDEIGKKGFLHVWGFKGNLSGSKLEEDNFFGTLLASNIELRETIVNSVAKSMELFPVFAKNI